MECKTCGRSNHNIEAHFCYYCGNSFRHEEETEQKKTYQDVLEGKKESKKFSFEAIGDGFLERFLYGNVPVDAKPERPMAFSRWIAILFLPFIPYIGFLAFIVVLFMMGFGNRIQVSQRNWARAMLIWFFMILMMGFSMLGSMGALTGLV